jgi:hypothetical protein
VIQTKDEVLAELMAEHVALRERAKELHPEARYRTISDNGPQFIAKHFFKQFTRVSGMAHVRTSPCCLNRTARSNDGTNRSRPLSVNW